MSPNQAAEEEVPRPKPKNIDILKTHYPYRKLKEVIEEKAKNNDSTITPIEVSACLLLGKDAGIAYPLADLSNSKNVSDKHKNLIESTRNFIEKNPEMLNQLPKLAHAAQPSQPSSQPAEQQGEQSTTPSARQTSSNNTTCERANQSPTEKLQSSPASSKITRLKRPSLPDFPSDKLLKRRRTGQNEPASNIGPKAIGDIQGEMGNTQPSASSTVVTTKSHEVKKTVSRTQASDEELHHETLTNLLNDIRELKATITQSKALDGELNHRDLLNIGEHISGLKATMTQLMGPRRPVNLVSAAREARNPSKSIAMVGEGGKLIIFYGSDDNSAMGLFPVADGLLRLARLPFDWYGVPVVNEKYWSPIVNREIERSVLFRDKNVN
ncbi:hypothetical protein Daus18300_009199 [Diaporthe australafricana]|uniref:Uncharacterized protein n=1 Tax=Diaporthe australafricana TaxID=127596 RepID=A0ABR3WF96_9PEZI